MRSLRPTLLIAAWNVMVANSIPQDSLLFDNPGDLFADSSPAPLTDSSSISVNDNMFNLVPNDGSLLAVLPSCEATSSLGTTDGLQARNGELCQPKINLPVDMLSDPEAWLRNNLPLPIEHEAPDEFFDPFFWPDGTENDRARVGADEEEEDGTCAFPYEWHVCCDLEVGWRAGTFFDEMVIDYMDGCDLMGPKDFCTKPYEACCASWDATTRIGSECVTL